MRLIPSGSTERTSRRLSRRSRRHHRSGLDSDPGGNRDPQRVVRLSFDSCCPLCQQCRQNRSVPARRPQSQLVFTHGTGIPIDLLSEDAGFIRLRRRLDTFSRTVWCGHGASACGRRRAQPLLSCTIRVPLGEATAGNAARPAWWGGFPKRVIPRGLPGGSLRFVLSLLVGWLVSQGSRVGI